MPLPAAGAATLVGSLALPSDRNMPDKTFDPAGARAVGVAFDGQRNYPNLISTAAGAASLLGGINSPGSISLGPCADATGRMHLESTGGRVHVLEGLTATPMPQWFGI